MTRRLDTAQCLIKITKLKISTFRKNISVSLFKQYEWLKKSHLLHQTNLVYIIKIDGRKVNEYLGYKNCHRFWCGGTYSKNQPQISGLSDTPRNIIVFHINVIIIIIIWFCTVHCNIIRQHKTSKSIVPKLIN